MFILIGGKPERATYAKVKGNDKVTASVRHSPLGAPSHPKTSDSKHLQIKDQELGQFKVVRENSSYCVQCTFPYIYHFFKIFKDLCNHALGRPPLNSSKLSPCPFIWSSHFILFAKFLLCLMTILEAK